MRAGLYMYVEADLLLWNGDVHAEAKTANAKQVLIPLLACSMQVVEHDSLFLSALPLRRAYNAVGFQLFWYSSLQWVSVSAFLFAIS